MYTDHSELSFAQNEIEHFDDILKNDDYGVIYNRERDTFWYTDSKESYEIELIAAFSPYHENLIPACDITQLFKCDWSGVYIDSDGLSQYVWFRKKEQQNAAT